MPIVATLLLLVVALAALTLSRRSGRELSPISTGPCYAPSKRFIVCCSAGIVVSLAVLVLFIVEYGRWAHKIEPLGGFSLFSAILLSVVLFVNLRELRRK